MRMTFSWPAPEQRRVEQTIEVSRAMVTDWRPVFNIVIPNMRQRLSVAFRRQSDPVTDEAWTPLSPKYKIWKQKNFPGKRILECTGALRRAATKKGAVGQVVIVETKSMTFGVELGIYPLVHQTTMLTRKDGASRRRMWLGFKLKDLALMFEFAIREVHHKLFRRVGGARVKS